MNAMVFKRIQTVLALLLVGSVSMLADGDDPFPDVDYHQWQNSMTITGKVMLNGVELKNEAIVAAYYQDEIRGKQRVNAKGIFYLSIGGATNEVGIPFHFKVFTGSSIVEVDQDLKYIWEGDLGSSTDPYLIDLKVVTTNTSAEGWATTCLPFNALVPDGVTVFAASSIAGEWLMIEPVSCTILPKDTPVLLKTESQTSYEWLSRVADGDAEIETNLFKGTTEDLTVTPNSVLTLGHATDGNKAIGFWLFKGTTVPANRAYMERPDVDGVRGFAIDWNETSGIDNNRETIDNNRETTTNKHGVDERSVYDLQGRKVNASALRKGSLLIINDKKTVVR